ncbi:DNA-primase RepB domain-containing protein [Paraburkholderia graminis]|uniref:DNA-primase RepB domain-containing protein n=1 Tax=Paraburkholderia graminis TaxID=60548 RepID=UPI0038BCDF93
MNGLTIINKAGSSIMLTSENGKVVKDLTLSERRHIAEEFLTELGKNCEEGERIIISQKSEVAGGFPMRAFQPGNTTLSEDQNIYVSIASVNKSEHKDTKKPVWARRIEHFKGGHCLMLDDIGSGIGSKGALRVDKIASILPPTAVIETSPDNFQIIYFFDKPCRDLRLFKNFIVSFVDQVMKAGGDKLDDPVRVFRVPFGSNTKKRDDETLKYADANGKPWRVRLHEADYDRRYSIEQICEAFKVEIRESRKYEKRDVSHLRNPFDDQVLKLAVEAFTEAGALTPDRTDAGKYRIVCPWDGEHTSSHGAQDAFLAGPEAGLDHPYVFSCSHTSCKEAKRGWSAFVRHDGLGDKIERLIEDDLNRAAAANDISWGALLFGEPDRDNDAEDGSREHPVSEREPPAEASVDESVSNNESPKSTADSMAAKANERARLEAKAAADLGVGFSNWMKGWCFSMGENRMCRPGNPFMHDQTGFNAVFGKWHFSLSSDAKLGTKSAWQYVQNVEGVKSVAASAYVMGKGPVFEFEGKVYVNLFDERSVPQTAAELSWEGLAAQMTIQYHLRTMFGNEQSAERIESWIAMNVQRPGELIGFAPIIKGIEGDGKTIIFQGLMGALLGRANVGQVSGDQVTEQTGWAKGKAVVAIEEIKAASGENRYHITNKLKPYVTNELVDIVDKYVRRHVTMNATNYVGMTNFANALPLKDGDRRWLVEFTQWKNIDEFIAKEGVAGVSQDGALTPYFGRILWAIREQGPQLRKFFLDYKLKQGMKWGMRAPDTESKRVMIGIENSDSGLDKIKVNIEEGGLGVSKDIVSTAMLNDHLARDMGEKRLMTRQISMMMMDLGYTKVPWDLKWKGKVHTVYVRDPKVFAVGKGEQGKDMANKRLRTLLDETFTNTNVEDYVPRDAAAGF